MPFENIVRDLTIPATPPSTATLIDHRTPLSTRTYIQARCRSWHTDLTFVVDEVPDPGGSRSLRCESFYHRRSRHQGAAGTVLTADQVHECQQAGARIIVAPDTDREVISTALDLGLTPYPGATTPTEAFAAIKAGATKVKLFPSSAVGISGLKAWREVLPAGTELFPVGGVGADNAAEWRNAGAAGLGLGSSLYHRGDRPEDVHSRAEAIASAWSQAH